jgi:hypothetical protein
MLIDGGPDPARLSTELDRVIPAWDRRIDLLVASHPHEDHLAGLPKLLDRYRIASVIGSEERGGGPAASSWREILASSRIAYHQVFTGDKFQLGAARLSVLWPDSSYLSLPPGNDGRALNDRSIVLRLDVPGFSALFTGDIESDIDARIIRNISAPVDFLKTPHHGSKGSTSRALLNVLNPRVSVVSVGVKNTYGHPAAETLQRLGERGGAVFFTDVRDTVFQGDLFARLAEPGLYVDSVHEIFVNKLNALLGRAAIRDLFDVQQLLAAGGDLDAALRDASRKDGGFSGPTLAWVLESLPVTRLARDAGFEPEPLEAFRLTLRERLLAR